MKAHHDQLIEGKNHQHKMSTSTEIVFEEYQKDILGSIDDRINEHSEMIHSERLFLNGLIRYHKPKKILEVGVAAGASSVVILNAIKDIDDAKLISHDYNADYYRMNGKKSGYIVKDLFPELSGKWELKTGGLIADHLDGIDGDIDFLLLDTTHCNPGELLDFLMILPFLKENAIVVIHDIALHLGPDKWCRFSYTCALLFSVLKGSKSWPQTTESNRIYTDSKIIEQLPFANIGVVTLEHKQTETIRDIFPLLSLPWEFCLYDKDITTASKHFKKHYGDHYAEIFVKSAEHNHRMIAAQEQGIEVHSETHDNRGTKKVIYVLGIPFLKIMSKFGKYSIKLFGFITLYKSVSRRC